MEESRIRKKIVRYDAKLTNKIQDAEVRGNKSPSLQRPEFDNKIPQLKPKVNTPYALDSVGRELSEGQWEYFKDSVIRDEQGCLKVMYRGGRESFTVFDRKKASHSNLYGRGFYFTDSESHARQYGDARAYYLKVTNPVSTEQTTITRAQLRKFIKAVAQNEDYGLDNYGYGATVDSVLKKVYGSRSDFAMLYDIDTVCVGDMVATVELFNEVNDTNYDGFILPTETVVFSSEQIKEIDNLKPTTDADIRYSVDRDLLRELDGYNTHKVITQKAVLPNFDSDFILGNEAKGITGILDQALNDPAAQDVVTAENMVYEKFSNGNRDINNADAEAIEEAKRVRDMAAQVAVQKTVEAGKVKTQTGAMWSLDSTGRELSNAQQEAKVSYSLNDNNSTGIKQQLQNHLDELNAMEPVVTIKSQAYVFKNKSDLRKQLTQEFEKSGAIVDRQGFGKVIFDETAMSQIVGYISLSDTAGLLAIKAAPAVVKRGLEIDRQINFKNRGFDTVTFAAPVKINGTRGNVAVVVRMIKSNRAHCVRIVLPDGSAFKIDNEKADTMSGSGLENQVQKRNGSAHKNNIPQSEQNVKKNFSLNDKQKNDFRFSLDDSTGRELSEGQREYFKASVVRDEQGRLKVMYRGGRESFTVFDRKKASYSNLYGRGFYFTDSESHARQYGDARAYYLKVTNPVSTEQTTITRAQLRKFIKAVAQNEDYGLDNYGYGATVDSVLKKVYGSRSDFAMLYDIDTVCVGDMVATVELFNEVNGTNYDGFILPTETVVFSSEQIKEIDNLKPTTDADIRYSVDRDLLRELDGYNAHKVITQKAVLPNFDSDFILGNEAKGITGILDQALNDPAVQDVVTAENMVYEKFSNWNRDINNADAEAIEEAKRVRDMTARVAVQKTVEAGGVEVPHANETETVSNISQHAMYSLCKLSDGRRFVNVDQDQDLFDGQPKNEYAKIAKKIISRKFQGKVIGIDNKMFVNGSGVAEYGYPSKNLSNEFREAKFRSAGELDNLLDAGTNFENVPDGQNGHVHPDVVDGFDWYDTLFRIGNRWFSGRVNIKNIARGKLFKDVTQIKDCTQDIIDSYGKNPKFEFLRQSSTEMLSQPVPGVKQNFTGEEFGGASHVIFDSNQAKNVDNLNPTDNPDLRYSLDRDLLRELDGYNTHGDSIGKQGKAVEKMFVQAFKEAKQDSNASLEVYADTLVAFDNLLPKLRKFVDGTLPDKSIEQLTDELIGIVDKALDRAKGEKKAHAQRLRIRISTHAPREGCDDYNYDDED